MPDDIKAGDKVVANMTGVVYDVLAVNGSDAWVRQSDLPASQGGVYNLDGLRFTKIKPYIPGGDKYIQVETWDRSRGYMPGHIPLPFQRSGIGLIKIDGMTGELSWAEGGPKN